MTDFLEEALADIDSVFFQEFVEQHKIDGKPFDVVPYAGTTELSEIPQAAYRSSRTSGGGDGDGMQFVFSPQIIAYGKADRAEIEQIMREQFEKFKAEVKKEIKEEQRREQRTKYA